jgi:4-hydroxy-tetrahydrodipicolinate synthase
VDIRAVHPEFHLLLGTGTPSLEETINLTREALEMGADGVVVLPPYYFRKVSDEGLFAWYSQLIQRGVPAGRALFGYHIPPVTGVPLSPELMRRLTDTYADRFAGVKDSSADLENARQIGAHFGSELVIFNGTDRLLTQALQAGATGCITALANLFSPELRRVWNAHQRGESDPAAQARLDAARAVMERYPPAPPLLKMLLARWHGYPDWTVRPPLLPLSREIADQAALDFEPLHND